MNETRRRRWDYRELVVRHATLDPVDNEARIKAVGGILAEGWDLVSVVCVPVSTRKVDPHDQLPGLLYAFRREVTE